MTIATGIIVGLLVLWVGGALASLIGFFLIGLGSHLAAPAKVTPRRGILAGASSVLGLLVLTAGPLASLWAGIATAVQVIGG